MTSDVNGFVRFCCRCFSSIFVWLTFVFEIMILFIGAAYSSNGHLYCVLVSTSNVMEQSLITAEMKATRKQTNKSTKPFICSELFWL